MGACPKPSSANDLEVKQGSSIRHSREGGNPLQHVVWIPAFAGMT